MEQPLTLSFFRTVFDESMVGLSNFDGKIVSSFGAREERLDCHNMSWSWG